MTSSLPAPDEIAIRIGHRLTIRVEPEEPEQIGAEEVTAQYGLGTESDVDEDTLSEEPAASPYAKQTGKPKRPS